MKNLKVNVLGTIYKILTGSAEKYPVLTDADGACDTTIKTIYIADLQPGPETVQDLASYRAKVVRHELVHAFFDEAGLEAYSRDELLVDWIAVQAPKMLKAFQDVGAMWLPKNFQFESFRCKPVKSTATAILSI